MMNPKHTYSDDPKDKSQYTAQMDRFYSSAAGIYDAVVKVLPAWKRWIGAALPHIEGHCNHRIDS